jgi:hypothetical protein
MTEHDPGLPVDNPSVVINGIALEELVRLCPYIEGPDVSREVVIAAMITPDPADSAFEALRTRILESRQHKVEE